MFALLDACASTALEIVMGMKRYLSETEQGFLVKRPGYFIKQFVWKIHEIESHC